MGFLSWGEGAPGRGVAFQLTVLDTVAGIEEQFARREAFTPRDGGGGVRNRAAASLGN
jgi:hypothetical protein